MTQQQAEPPRPRPIHETPNDTGLPWDNNAEQALLGALLLNPTPTDLHTRVHPEHYYHPAHATIHTAITQLTAAGHTADPITLLDHLTTTGQLQHTGGAPYLHTLMAACPTPAQAGHYANIVIRHAHARGLDQLGTRLRQIATDAAADQDTLDRAYATALQHIQTSADALDQANNHTSRYGTRLITAGTWLFDHPDTINTCWGHGDDILWATGETLLIAGPVGVGKTTIAQQLTLARIGLTNPELLNLPTTPARRCLYLAMDRPAQARRSLARMVTRGARHTLDEKLTIWQGPPPGQLITNTRLLLELAQEADADFVVIDSIKDTAVGIAKDDVGAAVNLALQELLAANIDVLGLHHIRKQDSTAGPGREPQSIDEIYGSTWITGGAGSVVTLWGAPGDPIVNFKHWKQPAGEVGPYKLHHDQQHGTMNIWHGVDIMQMMLHSGRHGLTAPALATALYPNAEGKNSQGEIEKARRRLEKLVSDGLATRRDPDKGGRGAQARYHAAVRDGGEITP